MEKEGAKLKRDAYPPPSCSLSAMSYSVLCDKMGYTVIGMLRRLSSKMVSDDGC